MVAPSSPRRDPSGAGRIATGPVVAIVDDEAIIRRVVGAILGGAGYGVREFADGASILREPPGSFAAVCLDLGLGDMSGLDVLKHLHTEAPDLPVLILSAQKAVDAAVDAMRLGAYDYLIKPVERERLIHSLSRALERSQLARRARALSVELDRRRIGERLIGESPAMRAMLEQIEPILHSDATVCLLGESGTGKEAVARTIHEQGHRRDGPFVALNCASLPEQLQESELFGHERGSFTGATARHLGCFERAEAGTLFLDELGDMALSTQAKLLRALQERSIRRVGGVSDVPVNTRIIAATHKDLLAGGRAGTFREDLYFRIMVYPLELPPLRERSEDIPVLVGHFLRRLRGDVGRAIERVSPEAMEVLQAHSWPGNVRELQNAVHRAMLTCATDEIRVNDLPRHVRGDVTAQNPRPHRRRAPSQSGLPTLVLRDLEELAIKEALTKAGGAIPAAAKLLGVGRATLYRRLTEKERAAAEGRDVE